MINLGYPKEAYGTLRAPEGGEIPDHTSYLDVLTAAAFSVGDREAGLKYLEQLAARKPNDVEVQERLGIARQGMNDPEGAAEALERAIALEPDRHTAYTQRSEEHTSELQSLMRISYAVFCLKKKNTE